MPELHVRPFGPSDLATVVALWNRCLPKDTITEERFWQLFLLDANFDRAGALVAEAGAEPGAGGKIVGFICVIARRFPLGTIGLEPEKGYMTAFFVDPAWRRRGVGTALLSTGAAWLRGRGCRELWCNGYAPYYVTPGVDLDYGEAHAFLRLNGFAEAGAAVAMGRPLEGARMPTWVRETARRLAEDDGIEVRMFRREDTLPLLELVEREFPGWAPPVLDGLQHGNLEIVVAVRGDGGGEGEVLGCTQWENTYNDPPRGVAGRFGPFGVRPDLRNRGLGAVIFWTMVERAVARGSRYLWFGWAGGRNVAFYERMGCRVTRHFVLYRKEL